RFDSIPKNYEAEANEKRQELIEAISNVDDTLGEMFLEEKVPSNEQLMVCFEILFEIWLQILLLFKIAIRNACIKRKFV
ncbi:hypothetical protein QIH36_27315, partial [Klebsiella pneumoniae]|nr:hypothetical protein [Klebsiella pneumoniae]